MEATKKTRTRSSKSATLGVRMERTELQRVDAVVAARKVKDPGIEFTRGSIVRAVLLRYLPEVEKELGLSGATTTKG